MCHPLVLVLITTVSTCPGPALHCCRLESQRERLQERRAALETCSCVLQFFRATDEEMAWVQEKLPLAAAQEYGQSLSEVRRLQEKHQVGAHLGRRSLNQPRKWC